MTSVSFKCSACGKCCNTAPLMSLPELFHHEDRFVGSLAIRRVRRHGPGDVLAAGGLSSPVTLEDGAQWDEIAETALFAGSGTGSGPYDFSVMTRAMDYESVGKCPALGDDKRCAIHEDRKPAMCSVVPFDPLYPDAQQGVVLLNRKLEENCIVAGPMQDYPVVVQDRQVESEEYRRALARRRLDLQQEKRWWGHGVYALLRKDLFENPVESARIPVDGLFSLSLVPVLIVLASLSELCRDRCVRYAERQIALIERKVAAAISRKTASDRPTTREFRAYKEAYLRARSTLELAPSISMSEASRRNELEGYLGLSTDQE